MSNGSRRVAGARGLNYFIYLLGIVVLVIVIGLVNSYARVRGECELTSAHAYLRSTSADIKLKLQQRLAIQQSQMWFPTWERVFVGGQWNPRDAWDAMFLHPIVPERNSGIQYVMRKELGKEKATELLGRGHQYVSGHLEIVFELFGPWLGWPVLATIGGLVGWLLRLWVAAVWEGRFLTAVTGGYVLYAFFLLILGGMPNFLVAWTFWVKAALFCLSYFLERAAFNSGRPLVPYVLQPEPAAKERT